MKQKVIIFSFHIRSEKSRGNHESCSWESMRASIWYDLRKYPADAKPDKLLKGFFYVVAAEHHIIRFILVNLLYDYLVIFKC